MSILDGEKKHGLHILIVEDDVDLAKNLQYVLEDEGYSISVSNCGEHALQTCGHETIDLALMDIRLPDISGNELADRLAGISPSTEYILITGNATLETAIKAITQQKIIGYETKPLRHRTQRWSANKRLSRPIKDFPPDSR